MSQSLSALRLRAALHLLALEGADISNIVRAHALSLGLPVDVCQPLSRESAAALDAVLALAAHCSQSVNDASASAMPSYEGIDGGADWFGDSPLGGEFGEFAFSALQHREGGGHMTLQFAEALSSAINSKGGLSASNQDFSIDSILAEASTDPRFATFVAEATTHNISYHSDGNSHGISYIPSAPLRSSLSPSPSRLVAPAAPSPAKRQSSSHAKVPPRKRATADVHWGDAAIDALPVEQLQQPAQTNAAPRTMVEESGAAGQPAITLASIVDIDAFLASVHKRN